MALVREVDWDEADEAVRPMYVAQQARRGMVFNYYRVLAQSPPLLEAIMGLERALAESSLDSGLRELAALAVYEVTGCGYQRYYHHHEARRAGLSEREVQDLDDPAVSDCYSPLQQDVIAFALMLSRENTVDEALVVRLREALGERALVELAATVGLANLADRVTQALQIELP